MPPRDTPSENRPPHDHAPAHDRGIGEVDRLAAFLHEIRNLLDGSLRYVLLAHKTLSASGEDAVGSARRQLEIAGEALERLSGLTHAAMQGPSLTLGSALLAGAKPVTLGEAVEHAAAVVRPLADEDTTTLHVRVAPAIMAHPAGPLYAVILNGLKNAVESVRRAGGHGRVELVALPSHGTGATNAQVHAQSRAWVDLEITDTGTGVRDHEAIRRVFDEGRPARADGSGLGLAVARGVVRELGGHIELRTRTDLKDSKRPGAALRVVAPLYNMELPSIGGRP